MASDVPPVFVPGSGEDAPASRASEEPLRWPPAVYPGGGAGERPEGGGEPTTAEAEPEASGPAERVRSSVRLLRTEAGPGGRRYATDDLLVDNELFTWICQRLVDGSRSVDATAVAALEPGGLAFAGPVARYEELPLLVVRPDHDEDPAAGEPVEGGDEEEGAERMYLTSGSAADGDRVYLVADVLDSGARVAAAARLLRRTGADVVGLGVVAEATDRRGRAGLGIDKVLSVVTL